MCRKTYPYHTYRKHRRHPCQTMHARGRGFCKKRDLAAGLGVMLVGKGGAADEGGGASACSSGFLQLVGVLGRGRCARVAAAAGGGGRTGGTRGLLRWVGLFRLDSGQPIPSPRHSDRWDCGLSGSIRGVCRMNMRYSFVSWLLPNGWLFVANGTKVKYECSRVINSGLNLASPPL